MKRIKLNIFVMATMLMAFTFFASCEKGPNFREFDYPAPVVGDFSPKNAYVGSNITIEGSDFGTTLKAVKVYFGGVRADSVRSVEDNKIVVMAPASGVSGKIRIEIFGKSDTTKEDFTYLPSARIISVSASKANKDDELTITGENFGTNQSLVQVFIGTTPATVKSVSATEIKFVTPDAPSGNVVAIVDGQRLVGPYLMVGMEKLTGTLIGHTGSWGNNAATTISAAVDGNLATFVDGPTTTGYVGYDLGVGKAAIVKSVRYAPRDGYAARMMNGEIRGANDPSLTDYVVLHKITANPPTGVLTEVTIDNPESFRYVYYYATEGNCNLAEVEFYGNVVDKATPVGKLIWEFGTAGDGEGWEPQQGANWSVSNGALNVTFTQASGNKRADLKQTKTPVVVHTGNYPIIAIKMNKPDGARITFDTNNGSFGNGFNKYVADYANKNVYYWDMSSLSMGTGAARPNEEISFSIFQFKVADIPPTDPATGYAVQWIRTFKNKAELEAFIQ
ncbi:DUF4979 domain-containing protein [Pelobium manganitolerans]|uniref:DUF4979 domain-containing protein n=1 Tax=Pelobium manganitolerans TaxID=1842495 RepID=UPI003FA37838